ncbi:MAG TPA: zinc ABC transporter substrate-binding protein [Spirochaetia bacterium]|nr:zinc ABC transporter substrate-binding protein [Spirochaetia bacterium]
MSPYRRRPRGILISILAFLVSSAASHARASAVLTLVAAENFWGDIARQVGGDKVAVTSIMSDPNVDPHEYESSVADAKAVADADIVIENGGGYDDWMDKLLSASPRTSRVVLKAYDLAVKKLPDNEHVWYGVENVQAVALALSRTLQQILPQDAGQFRRSEQAFQQSLELILRKMQQIAGRYSGTPVGLTETIYLYQAIPLGLKVLTPFEFQKAIAEGNDPPADALVEAQDQIRQKRVRVLIYNEQTASPVTTKVQDEAKAAGIPIVAVTETMPSGEAYQTWMIRQLDELRAALVFSTGR